MNEKYCYVKLVEWSVLLNGVLAYTVLLGKQVAKVLAAASSSLTGP